MVRGAAKTERECERLCVRDRECETVCERPCVRDACVRDRVCERPECEAVCERLCVRGRECGRLCVGESGLARERRACVWGVRSARTLSRSRGSAAAWPRGCGARACPEPPAGLCASPPLSRAPRRLRACCLAGLVGAALGASGGVSAFVCVSITGQLLWRNLQITKKEVTDPSLKNERKKSMKRCVVSHVVKVMRIKAAPGRRPRRPALHTDLYHPRGSIGRPDLI
ncbi:uncharacterized protein [Equus przewalskii]|uniref:Uncharacterized protein n=1 Tax=Equus przewalskii TaxID=9798 RepID=A0ABM4NKN3_EQUPR